MNLADWLDQQTNVNTNDPRVIRVIRAIEEAGWSPPGADALAVREALADAWDEGFEQGTTWPEQVKGILIDPPTNPYRKPARPTATEMIYRRPNEKD